MKATYHKNGDLTIRLEGSEVMDVDHALWTHANEWRKSAKLTGSETDRQIADQIEALAREFDTIREERNKRMGWYQ